MARLLIIAVIFVLAVLAGATAGAVRTAVEVGMDEHYEVVKGLLWAKGFSLYGQAWNDQPPLHTVLLGLCFKSFGATIGVARTLAVAFGLSLLAACGIVVRRRCGVLAGFLATACLLAAPQVLELSVSAMLELPAIGTALWALWPLLQWQERRRWPWLALSGGLLAAALQIKLTAAVVVPALVVEILLGVKGLGSAGRVRRPRSEVAPCAPEPPDHAAASCSESARGLAQSKTWRRFERLRGSVATRALGIWVASVVAVYLGLAAALGSVPLDVLWASHFSKQTLSKAGDSLGPAYWPRLWLLHPEAMSGAGAGLLLLAWRRDRRRMAFALVWLFTVTLVHLHHRPWWPYYYLHFAVPLAWMSGYGIAELFRVAWTKAADRAVRERFLAYGCLAAATLLLALVTAYGGDRLVTEVERIRELPRVEQSALVAKMKEYANRTKWVYTRQTIYPFHAGLIVVPELAVLPHKRFWSGQITDAQIWATVKRYRPEQLLLEAGPLDPTISEFVESGYTLAYQEGGLALYVAKSLAAHEN